MMLHVAYYLVVLMSLASHEYHIALVRHHAGCLYSLSAVSYHYDVLHLLVVQSCEHIVDDSLRVLLSRIVGSYNHLVRSSDSRLSHHRPLALVSVSATAHDGDKRSLLPAALAELVYRRQHIV